MKRFIAMIGMMLMVYLVGHGVGVLNAAVDFVQVFIGIFWMAVGGISFNGYLEDFKHNRYPFGLGEKEQS